MVLVDPDRLERRRLKSGRRAKQMEERKYDPTLKDPEFYGDSEETGIHDLTYSPPWPKRHGWPYRTRQVANFIRSDEPVLELGCGFGILPAMLWHEGNHRAEYYGIDFCPDALRQARKGNKAEAHQQATFHVVGLDDDEGRSTIGAHCKAHGPLVVTCCETLEHLEHDRELVESITPGTFCVFTVPQFWARSHLRRFPKPEDAYERYGEFLEAHYRSINHYPAPGSGWILIWGYRK